MENKFSQGGLNTPVLFIVFNRMDTTKKVFKSIKDAQPKRLFISSDGARTEVDGEKDKVGLIRSYLLENIDWDCQVETLFQEENKGCKYAVSEAIDWFFSNVEKGIILEDDCLPHASFFNYCEVLLNRFENDLRIWHIAGNNFISPWERNADYSYYFSYYGSIWGWATWKDRWEKYSVDMEHYHEIKEKDYFWDVFGNREEAEFRVKNFEEIKQGLDTWDFQWAYIRFINSGLSIVPKKNLVKNLGFGSDATHTFSSNDARADMDIFDLELPLRNPPFIIRDKISDDKFFNKYIRPEGIVRKVLKKISRK